MSRNVRIGGLALGARRRPDRGHGQHRHRDAARARHLPDLRDQRGPEAHDHGGQRRAAERELRAVRARPRSRDRRQRHRVVGRDASDQCAHAAPDSRSSSPPVRRPTTRTRSRCSTAARARCRRRCRSCRTRPQLYVVQYRSVSAPVGLQADRRDRGCPGRHCTLSTIDAGGVAVDASDRIRDTHAHAGHRRPGARRTTRSTRRWSISASRRRWVGSPIRSTRPRTRCARRGSFPTDDPVVPVVSDVVNLKAQYGLDTNNDGIVDAWQDATGGVWSAANLPTQPLATLRQIRAVRVAIVTRSAQYEKDAVTTGPLVMFDDAVSMTLDADDQHYRYKVLETVVPLRNALWNPS